MAIKNKSREAVAPLGRQGPKPKSLAKVTEARNKSLFAEAQCGRPKVIIQDGVVFMDEGGGTYIPQETKP